MPIDSLRPFRDRWSRPKGFTQCQVISEDEYKSIPNPKENTIYLMGDEKTGYTPACVGNWHNNSSSTSEPLKKITPDQLINNQLPPYFLDIAQRCGYTQLDAYYWENPYENFTNNLEINIAREGSLSFIEGYEWCANDLKKLITKNFHIAFNFSDNSSDSSNKKYTGLDGAIFVFFINLLGFVHFILRSIPGLFDILFEKAERALAEKSAPLWDNNNKTLWFVYAIPRGFFFVLKQPFKLAETAISTVFQTIDIALILSYSVTNIICGGLRPAKWKESWELVKESLPRLYSITLVRGFFIGLIGALAFFAPEILAFLGIGTAAGVAVLAVTGTAITATPKVLDEASEHCCPSSNNIINTGLIKQLKDLTIPTLQKTEEAEIKSSPVRMQNDAKIIPPIIAGNFTELTITISENAGYTNIRIGKDLFSVKRMTEVCYTLNGLTEKEKKNLAIDANTYNKLFWTHMMTPKHFHVFESKSLENLNNALPYLPANEWYSMMYVTAYENDANSIMKVFFSACSERAKPDCKFYTLNNPSADTYMQEALHLLVFLQHISKILSQSKHDDANIIKDSLDSESRISIAYSYQQAQKNYILYNQLPRGEEKNKAFENLKIYHREMFERVAELNTLYKSTDWSKVGIDRSSSVQPTIPHHHTTQFSKDRDRDRDSGSDNNNSITESVNLSV